jgi:hypothetical protein
MSSAEQVFLNYWNLYLAIKEVNVCKKCSCWLGVNPHGRLCHDCYLKGLRKMYSNKSQVL